MESVILNGEAMKATATGSPDAAKRLHFEIYCLDPDGSWKDNRCGETPDMTYNLSGMAEFIRKQDHAHVVIPVQKEKKSE
jgi:hypothetical protein